MKTRSRNRQTESAVNRNSSLLHNVVFFSVPLVALVILASVLSLGKGSETSVGVERDDD